MNRYGMTSDSPWPLPVPAVSVAVGTIPGRPVSPTGSVGDQMRAARGGAPVVPVVPGAGLYLPPGSTAAARTPPAAVTSGAPSVSRAQAASGVSVGATATPPAPVDSGPARPPAGGAHPDPQPVPKRRRKQP